MHKAVLFVFTSLLALPALASNATEAALAEQRDAAHREQQELQERAAALAAQLEETRRLLTLQDAYLERLTDELTRHGNHAGPPAAKAGSTEHTTSKGHDAYP